MWRSPLEVVPHVGMILHLFGLSTDPASCDLAFSWPHQVTQEMKLLKHLYLAVSNLPTDEEPVELPDDLTTEKMVTVVTAFFKASNNVIETVVQELLAKVRCNSSKGCIQ